MWELIVVDMRVRHFMTIGTYIARKYKTSANMCNKDRAILSLLTKFNEDSSDRQSSSSSEKREHDKKKAMSTMRHRG